MSKRAARLQNTIRPTERELRWFSLIDRHGPLSSEFLFEATKDTHRCKDTALRRLQALRQAGYLFLPPQQRQIAKADFKPYVYDLTSTGFEYLSYEQELERHARPTGHWWHGAWVSAVTAAIEIAAAREGLEYISASRILSIKQAVLGMPLRQGTVVPDQLFAVRYPGGYRAFVLEVDRGTEPVRSKAARKSLQKSVMQYREVLEQKLHQRHYGLKSNLMVLWVFCSRARERHWHDVVASHGQQQKSATCSADFPRWADVHHTVRALPLFSALK